MQVCIHFL